MASDNQNPAKKALVIASYRIQKALAKFAIHLGLSSGTMSELVRRAYIDAAEELLIARGDKVQATKIGAMTGLYRKEIVRLREMEVPGAASQEDKYNRSARVVTGWMRDADFLDDNGEPAVLEMRGATGFSELVKRYSGDMAMTALRDELERLGIVEITADDRLRLLSQGYVSSDTVAGIHILGADTADLIDTIHHNLQSNGRALRFQRKVSYVGIPDQYVDEFRKYAASASQTLLEDLDRWLAERDAKEIEDDETLTRLGLGVYHIEGSAEEQADLGDES